MNSVDSTPNLFFRDVIERLKTNLIKKGTKKYFITIAWHSLFSSDYHFEVSKRIRQEFENGRDYYAMHGRSLYLPPDRGLRPGSEYISWHNENVFRG